MKDERRGGAVRCQDTAWREMKAVFFCGLIEGYTVAFVG
ncbi:MAG: hypothetical protein BWY09_02323 [Candidatus Hydrogenedentes bacterium ADurb.Bin179]|nr:MAG: hypothetical protein BWY09_02323 [Candidatus Hydrogenedentes bacterium ADurb.Bin179]